MKEGRFSFRIYKGAIENIQDKDLSKETKEKLKLFHRSLKGG